MPNPYYNHPYCKECSHHVIDMVRHIKSREHRQLSNHNRQRHKPFHIVDVGNGERKRMALP